MKMNDEHGCSLASNGEERYDEYYSAIMRGKRIQYDYRTRDGKLFSCVAKSLEDARARRDAWITRQAEAQP